MQKCNPSAGHTEGQKKSGCSRLDRLQLLPSGQCGKLIRRSRIHSR